MAADKTHSLNWPRTDLTRWRLNGSNGAHRWIYLSKEDSKQQPQSVPERHFLGILEVSSTSQARCLENDMKLKLSFHSKNQLLQLPQSITTLLSMGYYFTKIYS